MILAATISLSLFNLSLGAVMALAWEWWTLPATGQPSAWKWRGDGRIQAKQAAAGATESAPPEPVECVPQGWLEELAQNAYEARSFVEAATQVLQLRIMAYREQLVRVEDQLWGIDTEKAKATVPELVTQLIKINEAWLSEQNEALGNLIDRRSEDNSLGNVANQLEEVLLKQTAQVETARMQLETSLETEALEPPAVIRQIQEMVESAHQLRDLMQHSLAEILVAEQRFSEYGEQWQHDPLCDVSNRPGLEVFANEYRTHPKNKKAALAMVLFDMGHFTDINQKLGTRTADELLAEVAALVKRKLPRPASANRLGRYSGQQFVALLGGATEKKAVAWAEKIRQAIQTSQVETDDTTQALHVAAVVMKLPKKLSFADAATRMVRELTEGKAHNAQRSGEDPYAETKLVQG